MANELRGNLKVMRCVPVGYELKCAGSDASSSVERGTETAVWLASEPDIPTEKFLRNKKIISG